MSAPPTQDKRAVELLEVEKAFHPFIAGPYNRLVSEIMQETGTRINIPPPSVSRTEIVFTGEKEQLAQAVARVKKIYEEKVACRAGRDQPRPVHGLFEMTRFPGVSSACAPLPCLRRTPCPQLTGPLREQGAWDGGLWGLKLAPCFGKRTWPIGLCLVAVVSQLDVNSAATLPRRGPGQ